MLHKVGIIAGGGNLPILVAQECVKLGRSPTIIVLDGQAKASDYTELSHAVFRIGSVGSVIKYFRKNNIKYLIFAGHLRKPKLLELKPDTWTAKFLAKSQVYYQGDSSIFNALIMDLKKKVFIF